MLKLLIASMAIHVHHFNKLVSRISFTRLSFAAARPLQNIWAWGQFNIGVVSMLPTAQNCGLLGLHFQRPRRNFGVGSLRNAPWLRSDGEIVFI